MLDGFKLNYFCSCGFAKASGGVRAGSIRAGGGQGLFAWHCLLIPLLEGNCFAWLRSRASSSAPSVARGPLCSRLEISVPLKRSCLAQGGQTTANALL